MSKKINNNNNNKGDSGDWILSLISLILFFFFAHFIFNPNPTFWRPGTGYTVKRFHWCTLLGRNHKLILNLTLIFLHKNNLWRWLPLMKGSEQLLLSFLFSNFNNTVIVIIPDENPILSPTFLMILDFMSSQYSHTSVMSFHST